jgi:hypothetical protein
MKLSSVSALVVKVGIKGSALFMIAGFTAGLGPNVYADNLMDLWKVAGSRYQIPLGLP